MSAKSDQLSTYHNRLNEHSKDTRDASIFTIARDLNPPQSLTRLSEPYVLEEVPKPSPSLPNAPSSRAFETMLHPEIIYSMASELQKL